MINIPTRSQRSGEFNQMSTMMNNDRGIGTNTKTKLVAPKDSKPSGLHSITAIDTLRNKQAERIYENNIRNAIEPSPATDGHKVEHEPGEPVAKEKFVPYCKSRQLRGVNEKFCDSSVAKDQKKLFKYCVPALIVVVILIIYFLTRMIKSGGRPIQRNQPRPASQPPNMLGGQQNGVTII